MILKDYIPIESSDTVVLSQAQQLDAILVSVNGDFANIVNYPPSEYKGIIAIQLKNHPEIIPELMQRLIEYLSSHNSMSDYKGKLLLVEVSRIRVKS